MPCYLMQLADVPKDRSCAADVVRSWAFRRQNANEEAFLAAYRPFMRRTLGSKFRGIRTLKPENASKSLGSTAMNVAIITFIPSWFG
jgi:hypothetical protein